MKGPLGRKQNVQTLGGANVKRLGGSFQNAQASAQFPKSGIEPGQRYFETAP